MNEIKRINSGPDFLVVLGLSLTKKNIIKKIINSVLIKFELFFF
tara:strand:+ start:322 stop:453 length:132 start_codon:yes stop_codon:yes gene_type:complete